MDLEACEAPNLRTFLAEAGPQFAAPLSRAEAHELFVQLVLLTQNPVAGPPDKSVPCWRAVSVSSR